MNRHLLPILLLAAALSACGEAEQTATQDAATPATVTGTLTLPGAAADKPYSVFLFREIGELPEEEVSGRTTGGAISYAFEAVPAGTYVLLGFVDVDSSGFQMSTPGDYRGWYGHGGDGEPPSAPNVEVPESGSVTYDWALVLAP